MSGLNPPVEAISYDGLDVRLDAAEIARPVVVTDYGVDRTGVADSNAGILLAKAAAIAANAPIFFPYGKYRSLSALDFSGVRGLIFDDAELDLSGVAAATTLVTVSGTLGTFIGVNAVAFGATSITGAAGIESGLVAGDKLRLRSADVYDPGRTATTSGEIVEVASTASGVINLRSPVMGVYSTTVEFAKITMQTGFRVSGSGRIIGGGPGSTHIGFKALFADKLRIVPDRLEILNAELTGLQFWDCIDFEVANLDVEKSNYSGTGYGFSVVNACQFGYVHHSHMRNCRHSTSTNNSNATVTGKGGIPRHITFDHIVGRDNLAGTDNFDTHAAAEYITFDTCKAIDSGNVAFNIECNKARLINCESHGSGNNGIFLLPCSAVPPDYEVRGCRVYDSGSYGIRLSDLAGAGASVPDRLDIMDNHITRCQLAAVYVQPGNESWRLRGARVARNRAKLSNQAGSGVAAFFLDKCDGGELVDNTAVELPSNIPATRLDNSTRTEWGRNKAHYASSPTSRVHRAFAASHCVIEGNIVVNPGGVSDTGLELDAASDNCVIGWNMVKGCLVPLQVNGVTTHIKTTADATGAYNKVA